MTTIKIKEKVNLAKKEYGTVDEFIEDYLSAREKITLKEIGESNLPESVKDDLAKSRKSGLDDLLDFVG